MYKLAEDFQKMTDRFMDDYQNRVSTLRGCFRDTRNMLHQVRPQLKNFRREFGNQASKMMAGFRADHKRMASELHHFLRDSTRRMKTETNRLRGDSRRMMQAFHTQSNQRKTESRQMHHAAQGFFKAMAEARQTHPLHGRQMGEEGKPARKHRRRRRKKARASAH